MIAHKFIHPIEFDLLVHCVKAFGIQAINVDDIGMASAKGSFSLPVDPRKGLLNYS